MTSSYSASRSTTLIARVENSSRKITMRWHTINTTTRETIITLTTCRMRTRGCSRLPTWMLLWPKQNSMINTATWLIQMRLSRIPIKYPVAPQISRLTTNTRTTEPQTATKSDKPSQLRRWIPLLWMVRGSKFKFSKVRWNRAVFFHPVIWYTKSRPSLSIGPSKGKTKIFTTCVRSSARITHTSLSHLCRLRKRRRPRSSSPGGRSTWEGSFRPFADVRFLNPTSILSIGSKWTTQRLSRSEPQTSWRPNMCDLWTTWSPNLVRYQHSWSPTAPFSATKWSISLIRTQSFTTKWSKAPGTSTRKVKL